MIHNFTYSGIVCTWKDPHGLLIVVILFHFPELCPDVLIHSFWQTQINDLISIGCTYHVTIVLFRRGSGGRGFMSGAGETELQLQRRRCLTVDRLQPI